MPDAVSNLLQGSEIVKSIFANAHRNVPILFGSFATCLSGIFIPESEFPTALHKANGLFLLATVFILVYSITLYWVETANIRQSKFLMHQLAEDEKIILRDFLRENKAVGYFSISDGVAMNLVRKGVLSFAVQAFTPFNVPIAIHPLFLNMLTKNPSLVGLKPEDVGSKQPSEKPSSFSGILT
jgi:hypothetical protein